jgi:hypothetical protein
MLRSTRSDIYFTHSFRLCLGQQSNPVLASLGIVRNTSIPLSVLLETCVGQLGGQVGVVFASGQWKTMYALLLEKGAFVQYYKSGLMSSF